MDIRLHNLFYHHPRHCCILFDGRDCRFISRRKTIFHPQQSTRISFKDFYMATVPTATIPPKVASHSTSNSAGIATKIRGGLRNPHPLKDESDDDLYSGRTELRHFVKLIDRSCRARNYDEALNLLKRMASAGYSPNAVICTKVICGFASSRCAISKAQEVMEILEDHGSLDIVAYNSLLRVICKEIEANNAEYVMESCLAVLDRMLVYGCFPDKVTYHIILGALWGTGHNCIVMKLLEEMASRGLQLDNHTYNYIVRRLCRDDLVDQSWQFMKTISSSHQPSSASSSSSGFKPTMAPDMKTYHILLEGLLRMRRLEDAEKLVSEMVSNGQCRPDVMTYSIIINYLCKEGMIYKAIKVLDCMIAEGLKPDVYSCQPINSYYCKQGRMDLAITFVEHLLSYAFVPDAIIYNTILSSLCKSGAIHQAVEELDKLEKMAFPLDAGSYNAFIKAFWLNGDRTKAMKMLSQMVDKGIHPDIETYNILISCLCKDGMVHHAFQLMNDMEDTWGYIPTVITYNIIILGLCKAHHIDSAIDMFEEMVKRGCMPNESTYRRLVEGLAIAGHQEEAAKMYTALLTHDAFPRCSMWRLNRGF